MNVLFAGSKPHNYLNLNPICNAFRLITRFNLALPGNNNGVLHGSLHLNNHLYAALFSKELNRNLFASRYPGYADRSYLLNYYDYIHLNYLKYDKIASYEPQIDVYNSFLNKEGCPYQFTKRPRVGIASVMNSVLRRDRRVFIVGFTVNDNEKYKSFYASASKVVNHKLHSQEDEVFILNWLHRRFFIDASFCFLHDRYLPTVHKKNFLIMSSAAKKLIINLYGTLQIYD